MIQSHRSASESFLQLEVGHLRGREQQGARQSRLHRQSRAAKLRRQRQQIFVARQLPGGTCKEVTTVPSCEAFVDYMATFQGAIQDQADELRDQMQKDDDACKAASLLDSKRINELKRHADDAGVALANAVVEVSGISSARHESRQQVEDLTQ